jgi:hypothetical protein
MNGHLLCCQSVLRAHGYRRGVLQYAPTGAQGLPASPPERIRLFTVRAMGARRVPPCDPPSRIEMMEVPEGGIWPSLNRLQHLHTRTHS